MSRPGDSHPRPLAEPDVNLSAHPAPIIQPFATVRIASVRMLPDDVLSAHPETSNTGSYDAQAVYTYAAAIAQDRHPSFARPNALQIDENAHSN